jgi:hypothetical protein
MSTQMRSLILLLAAFLPLASAQFNFFDQMFGHPQQQQQQQQQRQGPGPSDNSQWIAHSEARQYPNTQCTASRNH